MRSVRVAVPVPALDALTYRLPDTLPTPAIGARVLVPLGARVLTGIATESTGEPGDTHLEAASISARGAPPPRALARRLRASLGPQALAVSLTVLSGPSILLLGSSVAAAQWPQWRGPTRDGIVPAANVPAAWPEKPTLRWRQTVGE